MMESTLMKMSKVAFIWSMMSVLVEIFSRLRSLLPLLRLLCIHQRLVTEAHGDPPGDCRITTTLTLALKTTATVTETITMPDIPSTLILKPSSRENKWPLKMTFSRSLKQKSAEAGKFQNANLAPNALLRTASTSC